MRPLGDDTGQYSSYDICKDCGHFLANHTINRCLTCFNENKKCKGLSK